jgi:hypothetical protein
MFKRVKKIKGTHVYRKGIYSEISEKTIHAGIVSNNYDMFMMQGN